MEQKKKKQITIIAVVAIVVILLLGIGFLVGKDILEKGKLVKEINELAKLDVSKDNFDTEIKTSGNYGKVEEAIKEYFKEYANNLQSSMEAISEEKLEEIMATTNYEEDAPKFEKVLGKIKESKDKFNTGVENLMNQMDETFIMSKIEAKGVGKKYQELYRDLMFDENIMNQIKEQKEELQKAKEDLNKILDLNERVYRLLAENPGKWTTSGGTLKFRDETVFQKYTEIMKEAEELN